MDVWMTDVWVAQIEGRKKWRLFSPEQLQFIRPNGDGRYVDLERPDNDQFPMWRNASYIEHVAKAGQMLFVPSKWAHDVLALEPSVSLSSNFMSRCNAQASPVWLSEVRFSTGRVVRR